MRYIKRILVAIVAGSLVLCGIMLYFVWNFARVLPPIEKYDCECNAPQLQMAIENIRKSDTTLQISVFDSVGKHKKKYHFQVTSKANDYTFSMMYIADKDVLLLSLNHIIDKGLAVRRQDVDDESYVEFLKNNFISKLPYCK